MILCDENDNDFEWINHGIFLEYVKPSVKLHKIVISNSRPDYWYGILHEWFHQSEDKKKEW